MSNEEIVLRLDGVTLKNRFRPLSFDIEPGRIYALCGGNGAGKTSLFSVLTGMNKPSEGKLYLRGEELDNQSRLYRRQFSYMPDQLMFPKHLTGLETLRFFSMLSQEEGMKEKETLAEVGLTDAVYQRVKHYSKGMQQRLNLAQCLMVDVPIYMMDEPTNGLDPFWSYRLKEMLIEQKRKGKTIIFSTHSLSLVEDIADHLLFLQNGSVLVNEQVSAIRKSFGAGEDLSSHIYRMISQNVNK